MTTNIVAVLAAAVSLLMVLLLGLSDPKRSRLIRRGHADQVSALPAIPLARRIAACFLFVPGVGLMASGMWSAFLIWLGAVLVGGWLLAQCLSWASEASRRTDEH